MNLLNKHRDLEDALWDWASKSVPSGVQVIWDKPNVQRPCEPYVTLNIVTVSVKTGQDSWEPYHNESSNVSYWIGGQRKLLLSVIAYGPSADKQSQGAAGACQIVTNLRDSLENPDTLGRLRSNGIAVFNEPTVVDISTMLQTGFQDRSNMDVVFGYSFNQSYVIDDISKVKVDGEVEVEPAGSVPVDLTIE